MMCCLDVIVILQERGMKFDDDSVLQRRLSFVGYERLVSYCIDLLLMIDVIILYPRTHLVMIWTWTGL